METKPSRKPIAVLISDVHYNQNTLPIADVCMRLAIDKANALKIPFIVAGDLHDTKALLRGECVKAMIETFQRCETPTYVLVGNHDKINEKGKDHSLEFLKAYCNIVQSPVYIPDVDSHLIPYYSSAEALQTVLDSRPKGSRLIMHTGVQSAFMGHYVVDKASLPKESFSDFRVISGHYHRAQDIKCGRPRKGAVGLFSYIGNPYSLSFGEAADGPKGFQVLYDDGLMEQVRTNLRKHVVAECDWNDLDNARGLAAPWDLVWLKVKGPQSELSKLNKHRIGEATIGHSNFKLDLISTDSNKIEDKAGDLQDTEILDMLIAAMPDSEEQRQYLKNLWREIL